MRGMADDRPCWISCKRITAGGSPRFDSLYCSALLGCGELLLSGTTTILDMGTVNHQEAVFEAINHSGIRAISGKCLMDNAPDAPPALQESTEDGMQETLKLLEKWHNQADGRIRYAPAPRFVLSCSRRLWKEVADSLGT